MNQCSVFLGVTKASLNYLFIKNTNGKKHLSLPTYTSKSFFQQLLTFGTNWLRSFYDYYSINAILWLYSALVIFHHPSKSFLAIKF